MNAPDLSRTQHAYSSLKDFIRDGRFLPGQRMREVELAEMLGVSRTPVREALNRLISEGLLAIHPMRGFAVPELDKQQILELYGLREFLEGAAARSAAQHASGHEIKSLREMMKAFRKIDEKDPRGHAILNRRFHSAIASASHNRYLQDAIVRMTDVVGLIPTTTFQMSGRAEAVAREHIAIINAIEARDPEKAEAAARSHIRKAGDVRLVHMFGND